MVSEYLLKSVMLVEIGLLILAVGVFFIHGLWLFLTQKRSLGQMTAARDSLAKLLTRGTVSVEEIEVLRQLPRDVQVETFYDQSELVRASVDSVRDSLLIGSLMAVMVVVIFLRSFRLVRHNFTLIGFPEKGARKLRCCTADCPKSVLNAASRSVKMGVSRR